MAILLVASLIGCSQETITAASLSTDEKLEDFEYLYKIISENYPFLKVNERVNGIDWLEEKENFKRGIESASTDEVFERRIKVIVEKLNNGHTHVVRRDAFERYYDVYANSKGSKTYNRPWAKVFKNKTVLSWYGLYESDSGKIETKSFYDPDTPAFKSDIIVPDKVAYLKINQMNNARVEKDGLEIRKFYNEIKDYEKLIIDIRNNGGGSDRYWMKNVVNPLAKEKLSVSNYIFTRGSYGKPFYRARGMRQKSIDKLDRDILEGFAEEIKTDFDSYHIGTRTISPVSPIDFNGEIYLLVNRGVYSSSESFASFCKESGFATLVGTTTGGDGIGIDPLFFSLPNSGIVIRFSSLLALNGDGTINEEVQTTPNIEIDSTIGNSYEEDKAIQYIINN